MRMSLTSTSWAIQLILQNYNDHITEEGQKMLHDIISLINTIIMHSADL